MGQRSALVSFWTMRPAASPRRRARARPCVRPSQVGARCGRPLEPSQRPGPGPFHSRRPAPHPAVRVLRARLAPGREERRGLKQPRRRPPFGPPGAPAPREPSRLEACGHPSPAAGPRAPHLGTPRQARRARRPTPCPAGRRRRDAGPHSRTGSGRRDRKWRGGDSAAAAKAAGTLKKKFKTLKNFIWSMM